MELMVQSPVYIEHHVFTQLGLVDLADDHKARLLDQMNELVHKRVMLQVVELVPDHALDELEVAGSQGDTIIMEVLIKHVPSLPGLIVDEVAAVTDLMRGAILDELTATV